MNITRTEAAQRSNYQFIEHPQQTAVWVQR